MRSLVCAQCHVEYYFKGDGKYLTFPWDKGFTVEDMEAYYDEAGFYDYIHKLSRTPILKAQHPDYEICQMGIHGQRGVSCADCHMPYKSEGGVKFSDHHIQSPLAMIDRTCQVCHRESEETLRNNVYERQRKANEIRNRLEQELAKAHIEAKFAWDKGATETQMKDVLALIRQAQWRWDFGLLHMVVLPCSSGNSKNTFSWIGSCHASPSGCIQSISEERVYGRRSDAGHFNEGQSTGIYRLGYGC